MFEVVGLSAFPKDQALRIINESTQFLVTVVSPSLMVVGSTRPFLICSFFFFYLSCMQWNKMSIRCNDETLPDMGQSHPCRLAAFTMPRFQLRMQRIIAEL